MGIFSMMIDYLNGLGVFGYLAYFLLLIMLFYLIDYIFEKHVRRLKNEMRRKALAMLISFFLVILMFLTTMPLTGDAAAFIAVFILAIALIFFLIAMIMKLMGTDVLSFFQK